MQGQLEHAVKALRAASRRKPLDSEGLDQAKEHMRMLRSMAFSNLEVSELTGGGWSEPSVKAYTRGVKVTDPEVKSSTTQILGKLVDGGMTLDDVKEFLAFKKRAQAEGVTVESMARCLSTLRKAEFPVEQLPTVAEAAGKFGKPQAVLEAINQYDSIKQLNEIVEKFEGEKTRLEGEITATEQRLEGFGNEVSKVEAQLNLYSRLENEGYTEEVLKKLCEVSEKFGGPAGILEAVSAYAAKADLDDGIRRLEAAKADVEAKLDKLNTGHAHIQHVIGLCDTLLYEFKFTVNAITELYKVAKMYGQPIEVITAIQEFGVLEAIKAEVKRLRKLKAEKKAEVDQLELREARLRVKCQELEGTVAKMLESITSSLNGAVNRMGEAYSSSVKEITSISKEVSGKLIEVNAFLEKSKPFNDLMAFLGNPSSVDRVKAKECIILMLTATGLWVKAEEARRNPAASDLKYRTDKLAEAVLAIK